MTRYEDLTDEQKVTFDSLIVKEIKVRDEEIKFLKDEIKGRDEEIISLRETIRKIDLDKWVLRSYMIKQIGMISDMVGEAIESQLTDEMRSVKEHIDTVIKEHQPKDKE